MLEAIKLVGGIAGLLTTAFVIWDRWVRGRPRAEVTVKTFAGTREYISIKNPGDSNLLILGVSVHPPIYGVGKDRSAGAAIVDAAKRDWNLLLRASETRDLPIFDHRKQEDVSKNQRVRFLIHWRKTSSPRLPQVPVWHLTSTDYIRRIAAATPRQEMIG
jgi:hypothetical protein